MDFNAWLMKRGINPEELTDLAIRSTLESAWRAEQKPPTPTVANGSQYMFSAPLTPASSPAASAPVAPDVGFQKRVAELQAESARVQHIQEKGLALMEKWVGNPEKQTEIKSLMDAAIADKNTDTRAFDLAMIQAHSFNGPIVYAPSQPQVNSDVLSAAVCRAGGLKSSTLEQSFDDRTLSTVDKKFRGGIGIKQLVHACARANGWRGDSIENGNIKEALAFAYRGAGGFADSYGPMAIGPSMFDISGILSATANKFIQESFGFVESAWREFSSIRSVRNFQQITVYSMGANLQFTKLPPGGQIQHGTLLEESWTNQADTYAQLLAIDRRDIINDDLNAFTRIPREMGRGGALALNHVFWTEFLDETSGSFWTAARINFDDGTDTAFTNDGLVAADRIWSTKTDISGKPLGIIARILLVPPTLRIPALRLMNSQELLAAGEEGNVNPWAGRFRVVSSVYMENSSYTGNSVTAWYLIADPNDTPIIETVFLNGQQMPTVESVDLSADRLGMAVRGYYDFGVNKAEYRAALKLKGTA